MKKIIICLLTLGGYLACAQPVFDDESLQKIYDYRVQVEESAFVDTMKLCVAYRKARGLQTSSVHRVSGELSQHPDPEIQKWAADMDQKYGAFESASLQAWMKISLEGAKAPFSAIGGLKSEFNQVQEMATGSSFELQSIFENWVLSLYSIFLTESDGFLEASLHCLGDLSMQEIEKEIINFRFTILFFDSQASALSYNVVFWTGEIIFGLIFKGALWALSPVSSRVLSSVRTWNRSIDDILKPRFSNYAKLKKRVLYTTAIAGTSLLGYLGISYIKEKNQEQQELENMLQELLSENLQNSYE